MVIIFNLTGLKRDLQDISLTPEVLASGMFQDACAEVGLPVSPAYCNNLTVEHRRIYEEIKIMVEEELANVPTPKCAIISHLGNSIFHLDIHQ